MLQVDLRELARGPVETRGQLAGDDPLFEGLAVALAEPVRVAGRLQAAGEGRFYWRGSLATRVAGECRRCLAPVVLPVAAQIDALFSRDPDALEDPNSYPLAADMTEIDLRPAVREELLLAVPQWVVCRDECRGLCPRCGQDLNAGPCGCPPAARAGRWDGLAALKGKLRD
ncbi:MAG TPA: DUF177 domain-containing protein [Gemmatimonadales bacterium]|nr:DUF177 domain-containing protein [Gemmatimonadales bacterium]